MLSFVLLTQILACYSLSIRQIEENNIVTKTKIELTPVQITCDLNNMVKLSAPVINHHSLYRLYKPNGDVIHLNITAPKTITYTHIDANKTNDRNTTHRQSNQFNTYSLEEFDIDLEEKRMASNEFLIGPVQEEDGGNWVLSVYTKDLDYSWIELFQVITLTIVEPIELNIAKTTLHTGETLDISFAYPIKNLDSCELISRTTTFDRFYNRNYISEATCAYTIPNITMRDQGAWVIQGISNNIVYRGVVQLEVKEERKVLDTRIDKEMLSKKYKGFRKKSKDFQIKD